MGLPRAGVAVEGPCGQPGGGGGGRCGAHGCGRAARAPRIAGGAVEWLLGTGPHGQPDGTLEMRTVLSFCRAATRSFAAIHLQGFSIEESEMGRNDGRTLI
jgi:hypothetical protein